MGGEGSRDGLKSKWGFVCVFMSGDYLPRWRGCSLWTVGVGRD